MQNQRSPTPHVANAVLLLKRSLRLDMQPGELLPDERVAFDIERVHKDSGLLMRMLAWRRGALLLAFGLSVVPALLGFIGTLIDAADKDIPGTITGLSFLASIANMVALAGLWWAFRHWDDWRRSRKLLLTTWMVGFIVPFLIALFPFKTLAAGQGVGTEALVGMIGALAAVVDLGPKALSLLPGLIRAAMMSKVLLPRSTVGGWLVQLAAPFYLMLVFVILIVPYQLAGGNLMAPALFALMAGPVVVWRAGRRLTQLTSEEEIIALLRNTRVLSAVFGVLGGLFALMGLIDVLEAFNMGWNDAVVAILTLVANIFVLSVVSLDVLMKAIAGHQGEEPADTEGPWSDDEGSFEAFVRAVTPALTEVDADPEA